MSHNRNDSLQSNASTLSTLTSCSSESSVELYEEKLKPSIDALKLEESDAPIQELADKAETIIKEKFASHPSSIYKYKKDFKEISVGLDKIMLAMLACADEGGGESGKRYVACAILACSKQKDKMEALQALGTTWLTHLLFVFKTTRGHGNQPNETPGMATPTIDETTTHLREGVSNRAKSFRSDVLLRDGYTYVLTGFEDESHPQSSYDTPRVRLNGAHILSRAICQFDDSKSQYNSAVTTFDILVNFTRIPVKNLEELHERIDDADNGIILEHNAQDGFDNFEWCMKQTETEHVDRSNDFPSSSTRKRNRSIDLPNPLYIHIHATIAGVLNMSGAGKFFDELLYMYKDDEGNVPPVRSWPELEDVMEKQLLKESIK
ncbi:hypothetical protein CVT25_000220 [Psilocybe cyanescens]|uniref:HNH nuclease domain-containing protein n=1 Tax=Psilocybe cyanescens TaxID=93625 RepID=A0A409XQG5_PSICY|nr:hypothetical protein CVT25_000220 [Psilocybe cyanescens]